MFYYTTHYWLKLTNMKSHSILFLEPQCWGFEHVPFNAALIHTACLAYPSAKILFHGEESHLQQVKLILKQTPQGPDGVDFIPVRIPCRKSSGWRRIPSEFTLCKHILTEASHVATKALIFCSITNTSLLALKFLMNHDDFKLPTVAIPHGCLSGISGRQARRPWNWIIGLRRVLALPHPRNLRLIALGDSIRNNVKKLQSKRKSQWSSLDHVYWWPHKKQFKQKVYHSCDKPLLLGYLGASSKGFDTFCRLADEVAPAQEKAQFIMAGFYTGSLTEKPVCRHIPFIPDQPLLRKEFEKRISKLTYVVWTAKPDHYRLTASATFLDAMAFLKPGIYLRNDYIDYYFERMGDIGYLCDSYKDMVSIIREIISEFPAVRYQRQVENIRKGRMIFEPNTVTPRLRDIVESCQI